MIIFVTGGSASGKSEYAEQLAVNLKEEARQNIRAVKPRLVYLATMEPVDQESHRRISRHRVMRAEKQFETREQYTHLEELDTDRNEILLLECLSNLMANEMFSPKGRKERAAEAVQEGILHLAERCLHLVIVGNNVFEDGMAYEAETLNYLRETAKVHQFLGTFAHQVVEVICGIPVEWRKP